MKLNVHDYWDGLAKNTAYKPYLSHYNHFRVFEFQKSVQNLNFDRFFLIDPKNLIQFLYLKKENAIRCLYRQVFIENCATSL